MIWNEASETMPRERIDALQLERLRTTVGRILPLGSADRRTASGGRHQLGAATSPRWRTWPGCRSATSATCASSTRSACSPSRGADRPDPRVERHARQADRRRLHRGRPGVWSEVMARCLVMAGVAAGHGRPQRLRLRPVHRRARHPPGRRADRRDRDPDVRRLHQPPDPDAAGSRQPGLVLHAVVRPQPRPGAACARVDPASLQLGVGIFGAEPWTEEMRDVLERELGLAALNMYGLSEIVGPGVAAECREGARRHRTSRRTTSCRRSSIRPPARRCPPARRASWCSPR